MAAGRARPGATVRSAYEEGADRRDRPLRRLRPLLAVARDPAPPLRGAALRRLRVLVLVAAADRLALGARRPRDVDRPAAAHEPDAHAVVRRAVELLPAGVVGRAVADL